MKTFEIKIRWEAIAFLLAIAGLVYFIPQIKKVSLSSPAANQASDTTRATQPIPVSVPDPAAKQLREIMTKQLMTKTTPETWWLSAPPAKPEDLHPPFDIAAILKRYAGIDPLAKRIANTKFQAGYWQNGHPVKPAGLTEDKVFLCFVPLSEGPTLPPEIGGTVQFVGGGEVNGIVILGKNWPSEAFFAGLLIHEFGHAVHSLDDPRLNDVAYITPENRIEEEVVMHTLQAKVWDAASQGEIRKFYRTRINEHTASTWKEALGTLTLDDFLRIDHLLQADQGDEYIASLAAPSYLIMWAVWWIDDNVRDAKEAQLQKRDAYRWIHDNLTASTISLN